MQNNQISVLKIALLNVDVYNWTKYIGIDIIGNNMSTIA